MLNVIKLNVIKLNVVIRRQITAVKSFITLSTDFLQRRRQLKMNGNNNNGSGSSNANNNNSPSNNHNYVHDGEENFSPMLNEIQI
jgi:hypothetical protein